MLEGDLEDFTLPDVLQLLAATSKTGQLLVTAAGPTRTVGRLDVVDGQVRDASADVTRLGLARRLLGSGLVDGAALAGVLDPASDHAEDDADAHPDGLGLPTDHEVATRLLEADAADAQALADALREQTLDALLELLRRVRGRFRFEAMRTPDPDPEPLGALIPVTELLAESERRLVDLDDVLAATGADDAVVSIGRPPADVAIDADGWALLAFVDGRRTVGDLVALTGQGALRTRRALRRLLDLAVIRIGAPAAVPPIDRLVADHRRLAALEAELAEVARPEPEVRDVRPASADAPAAPGGTAEGPDTWSALEPRAEPFAAHELEAIAAATGELDAVAAAVDELGELAAVEAADAAKVTASTAAVLVGPDETGVSAATSGAAERTEVDDATFGAADDGASDDGAPDDGASDDGAPDDGASDDGAVAAIGTGPTVDVDPATDRIPTRDHDLEVPAPLHRELPATRTPARIPPGAGRTATTRQLSADVLDRLIDGLEARIDPSTPRPPRLDRAGDPDPAVRTRTVKILVTGPHDAGTTTLIRSISDLAALSTDQPVSGPERAAGTGRTTVAMDLGRVAVDGGLALQLVGTPGLQRFGFMTDVLATGTHGSVLVVDGTRPQSFPEARRIRDQLADLDVPAAVVVTKLTGSDDPEGAVTAVRDAVGLPPEVPVLVADVRERAEVARVLLALLHAARAAPQRHLTAVAHAHGGAG